MAASLGVQVADRHTAQVRGRAAARRTLMVFIVFGVVSATVALSPSTASLTNVVVTCTRRES